MMMIVTMNCKAVDEDARIGIKLYSAVMVMVIARNVR